jgi:hypothetical protein
MHVQLEGKDTARVIWLRVLLRVLSVGFLAAFIPWITLILAKAPILAPGGSLAPFLRFQPYNAHYESMMAGIHIRPGMRRPVAVRVGSANWRSWPRSTKVSRMSCWTVRYRSTTAAMAGRSCGTAITAFGTPKSVTLFEVASVRSTR